jgi:hypothetical protein
MLVASPSWAAVVQPGFGDLTLNQGQGFKPVTSTANAKVGDSVMVGPAGSATIVYEDGCKVDVRPGAVMTIAPLSPCASGSNAQGPPPSGYYPPDCKIAPNGQPYDCGPDWVGIGIAALLLGGGLTVFFIEESKSKGTTTPTIFHSP